MQKPKIDPAALYSDEYFDWHHPPSASDLAFERAAENIDTVDPTRERAAALLLKYTPRSTTPPVQP